MPPGQRAQNSWKGGSSSSTRPGVPSQKKPPPAYRWFGAAFIVLALIGIIAGLLWYLGKFAPTQLIVIAVDQYKSEWSPNPWAAADTAGVAEVFPSDNSTVVQVQEGQIILSELNNTVKSGTRLWRNSPVIVYLCMLGTVESGKVYLLPGNADPEDARSWIELDALLEPFLASPEKRLLVLDVRPMQSSRAIPPAADVNELLDTVLAERTAKGELPFLVLTANTPCDGPNLLRPLKRSLFGLALSHGASGAADGWGDGGAKDNRVSAYELIDYVREVTFKLSHGSGFAPQLPRRHGTGGDFDLLFVPRDRSPTLPELPSPDAARMVYPKALETGWKTRDTWIAPDMHLHRRAPRLTANLSHLAVQAERRWRAGLPADKLEAEFQSKADLLRAEQSRIVPVAPLMLSVARVRTRPEVAKAAEKLEAALTPRFLKLSASVKSDDPKGKLDEEWKADIAKVIAQHKVDANTLAVALFDMACKRLGNINHAQLQAIARIAADHELPHVEFTVITLMAGLSAEQVDNLWKPGTARLLLDATRLSEEAIAIDGRVLPRIQARLEAHDRTYRELLQTLANPHTDPPIRDKAAARLPALIADYGSLRGLAVALAGGWIEYEETRAVLADLAMRFPLALAPAPKDVSDAWRPLVEDYQRLETVLGALSGASTGEAPTTDLVEKAVQQLRSRRRAMLGIIPSAANVVGVRKLATALQWPRWSAAERGDLISRLEAAEYSAAQEALKNWPTASDRRELSLTRNCSPEMEQAAERELRQQVDLLVLVRAEKAADLRAVPSRYDPAYARRVRTAASTTLLQEYVKSDEPRRANLGWAVDPEVLPAYPEATPAVERNPEWHVRRNVERDSHQWLARNRYRVAAGEMTKLKMPTAYVVERAAIAQYAIALERFADEFEHATP